MQNEGNHSAVARAGRRMLYLLFSIGLGYVLAEAAYSTLFRYGYAGPGFSFYMIEDGPRPLRFDGDRGLWLNSGPVRHAQFTNGTLEYLAHFYGNNAGFPDKDEFGPARANPRARRLAAFGDSFTAAPFLETNWPDVVEDIAGGQLDLVNVAVDGAGLANWHSVLTRVLDPQDYQLDGLVFAVFGNDLDRNFFIGDGENYHQVVFHYVEDWNPATWPRTPEAAKQLLEGRPGMALLDTPTFNAVLNGETRFDLPRPWTLRAAPLVWSWMRGQPVSAAAPLFTPGQEQLIQEIAALAKRRNWTVQVVHVPLREQLIAGWTVIPEQTLRFAEMLGAECLNGSDAFAGLDEPGVRQHWLPYDGHWNQAGSDRFAHHLLESLLSRAKAGATP